MIKQNTVNTFNNGMVLDFNPIVTPNNVLTNCLNGTITTNNGNENVLLNDMGNGRVETAFLPEGYIPLGTAELGGIIYIVSYNPLINKSQIGCFPSPERNITTDEMGESGDKKEQTLEISSFYSGDMIKTPILKKILVDKDLHPGDKFLIYCELITKGLNYISAKLEGNTNANFYPRYLKLNVVSILDNGKIYNLNDNLVWNTKNNYYIYPIKILPDENGKPDLDEYRSLVNSNYSVFNGKSDGKLAILAELECIDNFDVSWDAKKNDNNQWMFYFYLNWQYKNNVSKDKINLHRISVECDKGMGGKSFPINDYPNKNKSNSTDILLNLDNVFYTPYYVDSIDEKPDYSTNGDITTPRKNDGTDNQYLLYLPYILPPNSTGIAKFTVYPGMPYGLLEYLKCEFSVNLDNLGTGEIDLKEYRYFYELNNTVTLNWALDAYPERNKRISSVKFNFYKFDNDIYTWIKNNKSYIDNNRYIKNKNKDGWENENSVVSVNGSITLDNNTDMTYTVPKLGSYSGHFTENISNLEENQLYLTEIEINYNNDEKIYKYYRFLYTSTLFNDYYFTETDYKNMKLQEALSLYHPIQHTISSLKIYNKSNDQELYNSSGNKVTDPIPLYVKLDDPNTKEYKVKSIFNSSVSFDLNSSTDIPLFDISTNIKSNETPEILYSDNSEKLYLESSQTSGSTEDIEDIKTISQTLNGRFVPNETSSKFDGTFKQTLETPLKVEYKKYTELEIPFALLPLDISCSWMLVDGGENNIDFYTSNSYRDRSKVADNYKEHYDDDTRVIGPLSKYPKIYNEIKSKLKSCDVAALYFRTYHTAVEGNEGTWTNWLQGDYKGGKHSTATNMIFFPSGLSGNKAKGNPKFLIYAILDINDDVRLFTFAVETSDEVSRNWYGKQTIIPSRDYTWPFNTMPFALTHDLDNDDLEFLKKPFEKYYKLVDSKTPYGLNYWSRIYYYNNYIWTNDISIKCKGDTIISINEVKIEEDGLPNNLNYEKAKDITAQFKISDKENFDRYIDMLLYATGTSTLVKMPNGEPKELKDINTRAIYDLYANVISFIKLDWGNSNAELKTLQDSKHKIKCIDGRLRTEVNNVPLSNNLMASGRLQEQAVTITDIIKITE